MYIDEMVNELTTDVLVILPWCVAIDSGRFFLFGVPHRHFRALCTAMPAISRFDEIIGI